MNVNFTVNGSAATVATEAGRSLLEVLREDLGLTGTKYGCGEGACGACTVLLDGKPVRSCLLPVEDVAGKTVVTIEGLARGGKLHPVQEAFVAEGAAQCGYCTPGMILETAALLEKNPRPTDAEIVESLDGHLCRCSHYPKILNSVRRAAGRGEKKI
jgi:carbon-monoxide dehydrogenase small subunit